MLNPSSPAATPARKFVQAWQAHNQRRWQMEKDTLPVDERAPFVCECTSDACARPLELTMSEFEHAHMCPNWCAVSPGHILPDDGGRVVLREPSYRVVELGALPATGDHGDGEAATRRRRGSPTSADRPLPG